MDGPHTHRPTDEPIGTGTMMLLRGLPIWCCGFLTAAPFVYLAVKYRRPLMSAWAVFYLVAIIAVMGVSFVLPRDAQGEIADGPGLAVNSMLFGCVYFGGIIHAWWVTGRLQADLCRPSGEQVSYLQGQLESARHLAAAAEQRARAAIAALDPSVRDAYVSLGLEHQGVGSTVGVEQFKSLTKPTQDLVRAYERDVRIITHRYRRKWGGSAGEQMPDKGDRHLQRHSAEIR